MFYKASNICATSSLLEKEINGLTKKTCTIIPFGVDLENFYAQVTIDQNKDAFVFGCTKYFESVYNIDRVIDAFYLLAKKYSTSKIKLHLIGNGSLKADLVNQAEKLGLLDKVVFVGEVENTKIPFYLNQFDVLINVSEYESFGVSIAEAMACKVPVIVSNAEGFKDLIPNSSLGLITTTEVESIFNCMEYYWLNAEARKANAQNSFLRVKEFFDIKQNVARMEAVYFSQLQQSV